MNAPRFPAPAGDRHGARRPVPGSSRIPTPGDCVDGFFEAFWRRPEALLDPAVRASQSMWALLPEGAEQRIVSRLAAALESGSGTASTATCVR